VRRAFAATVLYVYDELGRLVAEIDPAAETTLYSYDKAGNLLSVSRGTSSQFRIVSFAPTRGKPGDVVTIYGSGFLPTPAQNTVSFNGTTATVTAATANTLTVTAPAGAASGPISVQSGPNSGQTAQPFTFAYPPAIAGVSPGLAMRGTTVRIVVSGAQLATARTMSFAQAGLSARVLPGPDDNSVNVDLTVGPLVPLGSYGFSLTNDAGTTDSGSVAVTVTAALIGPAITATPSFSVIRPAAVANAPAGNAMGATRAISVHRPVLNPNTAQGDAMTVTPPISVLRP
jgi:YD repeat-containing protein